MALSWIVIHFRITDVKNRKSSKQILTGWHDCFDYQNEEDVYVYAWHWMTVHSCAFECTMIVHPCAYECTMINH